MWFSPTESSKSITITSGFTCRQLLHSLVKKQVRETGEWRSQKLFHLIVILISISQVAGEVEHLYIYLLDTGMSSWKKNLFKS